MYVMSSLFYHLFEGNHNENFQLLGQNIKMEWNKKDVLLNTTDWQAKQNFLNTIKILKAR
jgi:hypothetical protein